jgi:hypothetical protein
MAWDDHEVGNLELIDGDIVYDVLHGALKHIRKSYLERFGRAPYLAEVLYALCRIAGYASPGVVEDSAIPPLHAILASFSVPRHADQIDPGNYVGGFNDAGEVVILPEGGLGNSVVRVQIEDDGSQGVICRYSILSPEISDSGARCLIRTCALEQLLNYDILGPGFSVRFERVS